MTVLNERTRIFFRRELRGALFEFKEAPKRMSNEEFYWKLLDKIGWGTKTTDYEKIRKWLAENYSRSIITAFDDFCMAKSEEIGERINDHVTGVGDDGFSDLKWHIVGMGKEKFDAVMEDPTLAQKMVDEGKFKESFAYVFHEISDLSQPTVLK